MPNEPVSSDGDDAISDPDTSQETPDDPAADANGAAINESAHDESTNHEANANETNDPDTDEQQKQTNVRVDCQRLSEVLEEMDRLLDEHRRFLNDLERYYTHVLHRREGETHGHGGQVVGLGMMLG
ncbi:hypothetical protein K470DRAFT_276685 [Piedraia hortae CBS 480.64]|uniref:Uncharacterized protein n=1 Tax=Piedraia hortae CBS 480.64 TaxID=1314780 RepID=A0A6A7C281_9PEZI|nr:hypothetical protein K470DRAFT_276685 [Piedraia hortae CBS 480.64]